jgi:hypothetical protein
MNVKEVLEPLVLSWLQNNLTAPRSIKTEMAKMEEIDRLLDTVVRGAPGLDADGLELWWETTVREHGSRAQTRSWPTPKELIDAMAAAKQAVGYSPTAARTNWVLDTFKVAANRIKAGEVVGETWLYGSDAVALVTKGYVTEAELSRYREGLRRSLEDTYGDDNALRIMEERVTLHENAVAVARGDMGRFMSGRARGVARPIIPRLRSMSEPARNRSDDPLDDNFSFDEDPDARLEEDEAPVQQPTMRTPMSAEERQHLFEKRLRGDYGPMAQQIAEDRLAELARTHEE